jgi:hypothetical protein
MLYLNGIFTTVPLIGTRCSVLSLDSHHAQFCLQLGYLSSPVPSQQDSVAQLPALTGGSHRGEHLLVGHVGQVKKIPISCSSQIESGGSPAPILRCRRRSSPTDVVATPVPRRRWRSSPPGAATLRRCSPPPNPPRRCSYFLVVPN